MIGLEDLLHATAALGGATVGPVFGREFAAFSNDSRTVAPGELFVALRTEKADGHDFIGDAIAHGATGVLCERMADGGAAAGVTFIRVRDTRAALRERAAHLLAALRPYSIAVAGAVGKSSTCAALLHALGAPGGGPGVFSNANRNDELGLPLALGSLQAGQELAVLELAAGSAAELQRLGELVRPRILVLTSAGAPDASDTATGALRDGLAGLAATLTSGGLLIYNADDPDLEALVDRAAPAGLRTARYGLNAGADVVGAVVERSIAGCLLEVRYSGRSTRLTVRAPGMGAVHAALGAVAAAVEAGSEFEVAVERLDGLSAEAGRLAPLRTRDGRTLLDDTFNANVASLRLALRTLDLFPRPHAVVLGEISGVREAADVPAELLERLSVLDTLVLQGQETTPLGRELRARGQVPERIVFTYSARDSADSVLQNGAGRGGTVLVKGSDGARMEQVVALLLPESEQASVTLVRQDEGWKRRTYVPNERPTWVEVDLDAIRSNLRALQKAAAPAEIMAVLKADAYGHGARWVARTVALNGAAMLGVASLNEALDLRSDGITTPILILGYSPPWQARDLALSGIAATVFSLQVVRHFSRVAADLGREIAVHVKVDTGMTRLGVLPEEALDFVAAVAALPAIRIDGMFSHLATADMDVAFAREQGERFARLLAVLEAAGHRFRYVHLQNSAAVLRGLPSGANLVRTGMALYGLYPLPRTETPVQLRPALAFKTRVAQVKCVPAGTGVSYGRTFVTQRESRIAVLPVGYGDGFRRSPSHWGQVLVRGQRAPLVGVVSMDMTMVDVTEIQDVQEGDEVVLIGRQGEQEISAEDVAAALGTIAYEVVTQILPRVPRQLH